MRSDSLGGLRRTFLILALCGLSSASRADGTRVTALEQYGLGGHIQPVGIHHGFHVETVAVDSPAEADQLRAHDVIVKVDGDVIRSLDHLRAVLAEAYMEDGEVAISYTRGGSIAQHTIRCHLKRQTERRVAKRRRADPEDDAPR